MRIEEAELRTVPLRLKEPFEISSGVQEERLILLLALRGEGLVGWGECVAGELPNYSYETTETAWYVLTEILLPAVVGREVEGPEDALAPVAWVRGHPMARAAVEMAAWDLHAKVLGVPLAEALGSEPRPVPAGVSIGLQPDDDTLLWRVDAYLEEGYRRIKIKIKPGRDVAMLRAVRTRFPDTPLMADANSAFSLADAPLLEELDALDLMMIEQPLAHDDLLDHARLQERLNTPICLDESIRGVRDAELALELGACQVINIKPGRVGGLGEARRIHDVCRAQGVPVWCGGMLESGVGRAHNVALASLPGFTLPGDLSASRRYWERDLVEPEFETLDGTLRPAPGPGIGVRPDVARIEELTTRLAVVHPRAGGVR